MSGLFSNNPRASCEAAGSSPARRRRLSVKLLLFAQPKLDSSTGFRCLSWIRIGDVEPLGRGKRQALIANGSAIGCGLLVDASCDLGKCTAAGRSAASPWGLGRAGPSAVTRRTKTTTEDDWRPCG
ncbi:hypothetical protein CDD83_6270 [Cordyceps sp. RAO-2017]|nr:hypothetical protein CDD83_6270 [Cordyceps sp. RAO-2017]